MLDKVNNPIILPVFCIAFLFLTRGFWISRTRGKANNRYILSLLVYTVSAICSFFNPIIKSVLSDITTKYFKDNLSYILDNNRYTFSPSTIITILIIILVFFLNNKNKDTVLTPNNSIVVNDFPKIEFTDRFDRFCKMLAKNMESIDNQYYWSSEGFVQLEAEVEVKSGVKHSKRILNLLSAIRFDKQSRVFLVLGEPGSGKSVALRKLCNDLLYETNDTGIIPIYINLKEWEVNCEKQHIDLYNDLKGFVIKNLKNRLCNPFSHTFIDDYFDILFERGRIFMVFDSFDEIPIVIDEKDNSEIIKKLSDVIYDFITGMNNSRGVVSSRLFKKPADRPQVNSILEIRPFSDNKIAECIKRSINCSDDQIKEIFSSKQDIITSIKNPFICSLLANYILKNGGDLPANQADMYKSYIDGRLKLFNDLISKYNLTNEKIIEFCIDISYLMFKDVKYGLEIPVEDIKKHLPQYAEVDNIINILENSKIGRVGFSDSRKFSFIHRRFNEYFQVLRLINKPHEVDIDSIATDRSLRDALVLYCEVVDTGRASEIAGFCWSEISKIYDLNLDRKDPQYLRVIHCLRFLKDAFRSRVNCIFSFKNDLAGFIINQIGKTKDLLSMKLAVESVGLLETDKTDEVIINALKIQNPWISETALRACRNLPNISIELLLLFKKYINSIGVTKIFQRQKELLFSFKLSDGFKKVYSFYKAEVVDLILFAISTVILLMTTQVFVLILVFLLPVLFLFILNRALYFSGVDNKSLSSFQLAFVRVFMFLCLASMMFSSNIHMFQYSIAAFVFRINSLPQSLSEFFKISYFITLLPLIPWHQTTYFISVAIFQIKNILKKPKQFLLVIGLIVVYLLCIFGFMYLTKTIPKDIKKQISLPLTFVLALLLLSVVIYGFIHYFRKILFDRKLLKSFKTYSNVYKVRRTTISEQFIQFKTNIYRLRYVNLFQSKNGEEIEGDWPDGILPNVKNDEASTRLAQLEERWLGF